MTSPSDAQAVALDHPIPKQSDRLPWAALLALSLTSFLATANETVPAGLLPQIAQGLAVSEGWAGQFVTLCALAWLFLKLAQEGELRQQLLERGLDPRAVRRAVRYGRGEEFGRAR